MRRTLLDLTQQQQKEEEEKLEKKTQQTKYTSLPISVHIPTGRCLNCDDITTLKQQQQHQQQRQQRQQQLSG